jgi:hypothetical protein
MWLFNPREKKYSRYNLQILNSTNKTIVDEDTQIISTYSTQGRRRIPSRLKRSIIRATSNRAWWTRSSDFIGGKVHDPLMTRLERSMRATSNRAFVHGGLVGLPFSISIHLSTWHPFTTKTKHTSDFQPSLMNTLFRLYRREKFTTRYD